MNLRGLQTLLGKEVKRFMRVPGQTVLSPLVSTTLYFVVFGYSLGGQQRQTHGVPYMQFIVPGLVFLGIANNAFLNASSSLFITKIQGIIVDMLVAPLGPVEILGGFVGGAMIRGLCVGLLTWLVALPFAHVTLLHPLATLFFLFMSAYVFAVLGLLAGVWSEKFEQINFFPTFVMLPLTFLGGVFYSIGDLPPLWRTVSMANPMVYMVDGLRYGMLGTCAFSPVLGAALLLGTATVATALTFLALQTGYKLKT